MPNPNVRVRAGDMVRINDTCNIDMYRGFLFPVTYVSPDGSTVQCKKPGQFPGSLQFYDHEIDVVAAPDEPS